MSLANRAQQTSSTKGTGPYVLDGTRPGRQRISAAITKIAARHGLPGGTVGPWKVRYSATDQTGRHEVGHGTLTRGTGGSFDTLTRDEILDSAASDGPVSWPAGTRTITVTIDADAVASLLDLTAPLGPMQRTGRDRYGWGIRADGTSDDSDALEAALNNSDGLPVLLPPGTIRVARPLNITARTFHLAGQRAERGQPTAVIDNPGTLLDCREIGAGKWFISRFEPDAPLSILGPFTVENLAVDLGAAHGFEFGRADLAGGSLDRADYGVVGNTTGQAFIFGVQFNNCRIKGIDAVHASDVDGRLTRSGQRLIMLTKAFESTIDNVSTRGGDIAIETWGCDAPIVRNTRVNHCHVPLLMQGSGSFLVEHRVRDFQSEHYTIAAIITDSCAVDMAGVRTETNVGWGASRPNGYGRWDMTDALGITCAVTAGSLDLTFSEPMNGRLFAHQSVIRVFDGEHADYCLVTAVDGATVTVWGLSFAFDWSAGAASCERFHGIGLLCGGTLPTKIMGGALDSYLDCPAIVYRAQSGPGFFFGIGKNPGINNPVGDEVRSIVIGNKATLSPNFTKGAYFWGCSPSVQPEPHPLAWSADFPAQKGWFPQNAGFRMPRRSAPDEIADIPGFRQWAFTPDGYTISTDGLDGRIVRKVAGDPDTLELHSIWEVPRGSAVTFYGKTIPSQAHGTTLEIVMVARARAAASSLTWQVLGVGGSANRSISLGSDWHVAVLPYQGIPPQWGTGRTGSNAGVRILAGDEPIQIRALFVRERPLVEHPNGYRARGSWRKFLPIAGGPPKTSGAVAMAVVKPILASPNNVRLRIGFSATPRGATQGYAWVTGDYIAHITTFSGNASVAGAIVEVVKTQQSANAAILNADVVLSTSGSGSGLTVSAEVSLSGSSAAGVTEMIAYLDIEALGEAVHLEEA